METDSVLHPTHKYRYHLSTIIFTIHSQHCTDQHCSLLGRVTPVISEGDLFTMFDFDACGLLGKSLDILQRMKRKGV